LRLGGDGLSRSNSGYDVVNFLNEFAAASARNGLVLFVSIPLGASGRLTSDSITGASVRRNFISQPSERVGSDVGDESITNVAFAPQKNVETVGGGA